jgi:hypothetical protein
MHHDLRIGDEVACIIFHRQNPVGVSRGVFVTDFPGPLPCAMPHGEVSWPPLPQGKGTAGEAFLPNREATLSR